MRHGEGSLLAAVPAGADGTWGVIPRHMLAGDALDCGVPCKQLKVLYLDE